MSRNPDHQITMSWKPDYQIKAYYPPNAERNGLAIHTWHMGKTSRDIETEAFKARMRRGEIGYIEIISLVEPYGVTMLYAHEVKP